MPNDSREARAESIQFLLPWGMPSEVREEFADTAVWWLSGGAVLLVWTGIALLLTAA